VMRNLGGAIGIAVVNTWLQDNRRIAAARISEALGHAPHGAQDMLAYLSARFYLQVPDMAVATTTAQALLSKFIGQQAMTLAFNDVFRLMCWMFLAALLLVPLCRPESTTLPADAGAH